MCSFIKTEQIYKNKEEIETSEIPPKTLCGLINLFIRQYNPQTKKKKTKKN